jgi:hypothetical protein
VGSVADPHTLSEEEIRARLLAKGLRIVDKRDLTLLARAEQRLGPVGAPNSFHFKDEQEIFRAMDEELERENPVARTPEAAAD